MKYNIVQVCGHPRSGTHYIAALIHKNFFNKEGSYLECYGTHKIGSKMKIRSSVGYIYVWRNFKDLSESFYNMRHRFGVPNETSYKEFLRTKYSDIWTRDVGKFKIKINTGEEETFNTNVCNLVKNSQMTPSEYWLSHMKSWVKLSESFDNIFIVGYNEIRKYFEETMIEIADYLKSNKTEFVDVKEKVGWIP